MKTYRRLPLVLMVLLLIPAISFAFNVPIITRDSWKSIESNFYNFKLERYPINWNIWKVDDGFFITKLDSESRLAILPKGEFDYGLPSSDPVTSTNTIDGKRVMVHKWNLDNGTLMHFYVLDNIKNWVTCGDTPVNCNRIDVYAENDEDLKVLLQMVDNLKFKR